MTLFPQVLKKGDLLGVWYLSLRDHVRQVIQQTRQPEASKAAVKCTRKKRSVGMRSAFTRYVANTSPKSVGLKCLSRGSGVARYVSTGCGIRSDQIRPIHRRLRGGEL